MNHRGIHLGHSVLDIITSIEGAQPKELVAAAIVLAAERDKLPEFGGCPRAIVIDNIMYAIRDSYTKEVCRQAPQPFDNERQKSQACNAFVAAVFANPKKPAD